jgi:putative inorganic carbon (hco3(-)) transporter
MHIASVGEKSSKIVRLYNFLFAFLLFFTPLVFVNNTGELYEFPKTLFVCGVGGLIVFVFALDVLLRGRRVASPGFPVLFFMFSAVVSTVFSQHFYTSFWGYYTRFNDSLLILFIFSGLYVVARSVLSLGRMAEIVKLVLMGAVLISVYGIFQHFTGVTRVYSTFGQPNWLAQYLGMLLPLALLLFFSDRKLLGIWYPACLLMGLCLWFTYSISGFVGAIVGCGLFLGSAFLAETASSSSGTSAKKTVRTKTLLLVAPAILFIILFPGIFRERLHDVLYDIRTVGVSQVHAASSIVVKNSDGHALSDSGAIRAGLWKGTWKLILSSKKVFLLGAGLETFPYAFQRFRPASLNYTSEWEYVFNKPHNYFLELWAEQGLLGLLTFVYWGIDLLRKSPGYLIPSMAAFFVSSFFGWPTVAPFLLFWLLASFAARFENPTVVAGESVS